MHYKRVEWLLEDHTDLLKKQETKLQEVEAKLAEQHVLIDNMEGDFKIKNSTMLSSYNKAISECQNVVDEVKKITNAGIISVVAICVIATIVNYFL